MRDVYNSHRSHCLLSGKTSVEILRNKLKSGDLSPLVMTHIIEKVMLVGAMRPVQEACAQQITLLDETPLLAIPP